MSSHGERIADYQKKVRMKKAEPLLTPALISSKSTADY